MKTIITIQHTQSVHHINGMIGSWTDWSLTDLGISQAKYIGRNLAEELRGKSCKIYSSDLLRAKQTAQPLAEYLGLDIEYSVNLREINNGEACGKSKEWGRENKIPVTSFDAPEYKGAESWQEFWCRVNNAINEILSCECENIIIVSHGGTLKVLQEIWIDNKLAEYTSFGKSGSVSFLTIGDDGNRSVLRHNDLSYIKG